MGLNIQEKLMLRENTKEPNSTEYVMVMELFSTVREENTSENGSKTECTVKESFTIPTTK